LYINSCNEIFHYNLAFSLISHTAYYSYKETRCYIYGAFNLATSITVSMLLYLPHCTIRHKTRKSTDHGKRTDRRYI